MADARDMADPFESLTSGYAGTTSYELLLCPVCGSTSEIFERPRIIDPQHAISVDLRRCTACHHGWISPMPTQAWLDSLYASGSNAVIGVGWADETPHALTLPEAFMVGREQGRPARRYFELGVGKGVLYETFLKAGWQCTGVEPGAWGKFSGVIGSIDELPAAARFDLMAAFDVLEHLERPIDFLSRMRSAAAPGARVYMSFPNIDSFRARKQKAAWRMVRPLGHTHYY
jgi:hypothetical protein